MCVDHSEGSGLAAQIIQDAAEHRVLKHIGEAAGVEGVAIIHYLILTPQGGRGTASASLCSRVILIVRILIVRAGSKPL